MILLQHTVETASLKVMIAIENLYETSLFFGLFRTFGILYDANHYFETLLTKVSVLPVCV